MRYSCQEPPPATLKSVRSILCAASLICLLSGNAFAQNPPEAITGLEFGLIRDICIDELFVSADIVLTPPKVPVGCTLIDCCPGCGFTPEINVAIELSSDLNTEVEVKFENLANPGLLTLTPPGAATWAGTTLKVTRDVVVSGFQRDPTTTAVMAQAELKFTDDLTAGGISLSEVTSLGDTIAALSISAADYPLSQYAFKYRPRLCAPEILYPPPPGDFISLLNNSGADQSVIMLDAQTAAGCVDDHRSAATTSAPYQNFFAPDVACRNEVSVYSRQDAAVLLDNADTGVWAAWKDTAGNVQQVDLDQAPWEMPSNVWISATDADEDAFLLNLALAALLDFPLIFDASNTPAMLQARAKLEMDYADMLFDLNKTGIDVNEQAVFTIINQLEGMLAIYMTALALHASGDCSMTQILNYQNTIVPLGGPSIYEEGELNIYYIAADWITEFFMDPITGLECPGVVFVGTAGNDTSLAHELGHVFSLGHVHDIGDDCDAVVGADDFETNNIMWPMPAGLVRDEFTIGQNFRMSFNTSSGLNYLPKTTPARSSGPTVSCPDDVDDETCLCLSQR
ncbi:MAG: hypothetical protein OEM64_15030 [Gammaproteobacteria bacterium]|nr:hypothetical protein [Gammaproteobacteria bacterium]MDH3417620.1 hypothetical protein [Gammaproteobacteria bacterium]